MIRSNSPRLFTMIPWLVAVVLATGCEPSDRALIAREIHGTWTTTAPSHADRAFVITRDSIYLHQGNGIVASHRIRGIRRVPRPDHVAYTIRFDGIVQTLDLRLEYYERGEEPFIQIRNQPRVRWHRGNVPGDGAIAGAAGGQL